MVWVLCYRREEFSFISTKTQSCWWLDAVQKGERRDCSVWKGDKKFTEVSSNSYLKPGREETKCIIKLWYWFRLSVGFDQSRAGKIDTPAAKVYFYYLTRVKSLFYYKWLSNLVCWVIISEQPAKWWGSVRHRVPFRVLWLWIWILL